MSDDAGVEPMGSSPDGVIRIALVDDHRLFREGVRRILAAEEDFEVVAEGTPCEAVALAERFQPDVLVMDVQRASVGPVPTIRHVVRVAPATRVVVLSVHSDSGLILSMADAGAAAYLTKNVGGRELCSEVRMVIADSRMFALRVPRQAVPPPPEAGGKRPAALTDRELEILRLVNAAMTNSQIAGKLFLSEATVKRHLTNIFHKLKARSRLEAVNRAIALGLLENHEWRWLVR